MMNATVIRKIIIFMMMSIPHVSLFAQLTPFPGSLTIEGQIINSGSHVFSHPASIISPGNPSNPVSISNTANVTFQSATEVLLKNGFEAGGFAGNGQFLGKINQNLDMVLVTPDPANSIINGQVHVPKWEKLEIALKLPNEYQTAINNFFAHYWNNAVNPVTDLNPYAFDSLEVRFDITKPDGTTQLTRWAFFMRPGRFANNAPPEARPEEDIDDDYFDYPFRFRFTPDVESNGNPWTFSITIRAPHGISNFPEYHYSNFQFYCDPPLPDNHGFLKVATNKRNLKFDNGTPFFAIGLNMADQRHWNPGPGSPPLDWRLMHKWDFDLFMQSVDYLASAGGNYLRTYLFKYTFAPEWEHLGVYDAYEARPAGTGCPDGISGQSGGISSGNRQWNAWMFDEFLNRCEEQDVYLQLCIEPGNPIVAYQTFIWGDHPYVINYVYPTSSDGNNDGLIDQPYDTKEFFVSSGVNDPANDGVMYYWKRRYKYILSRWGYSTNIASIETFNEVNQTLGYYDMDLSGPSTMNNQKMLPEYLSHNSSICPDNRIEYVVDNDLIGALRDYHDYLVPYVKNELDDNNHMMNTSYGWYVNPVYNDLFDHPDLDFNDAHNYDDSQNANTNRFDVTKELTDDFEKPFIFGESSTFGHVELNPGAVNKFTYEFYNNYDISFHNEIWSSAMSGAMGTGLSWFWQTVFWWPDGNPRQFEYNNQTHFVNNGLGETNTITIDGVDTDFVNSTFYHQYKPLSDFLQNLDLSQPYEPAIYTDIQNGIQAIYNIPQLGGYPGYGWVHNYNNTWHTKWVMDDDNNYFEDNTLCTSSGTDIFTIRGLIPNKNYNVSFYPTRMSGQTLPNDFNGTAVSCSGTGCLNVDMDFTLGCDTTDSDFAFIITCTSCTPQQRLEDSNNSGFESNKKANYEVFPNPSGKNAMLNCPSKDHYICVIIDSHGKQVREFEFKGDYYLLDNSKLQPGLYLLQIKSKADVIYKKLIIE